MNGQVEPRQPARRKPAGLILLLALVVCAGARAQIDPDDAANKAAEIEPLASSSLLLDLAMAGSRIVRGGRTRTRAAFR